MTMPITDRYLIEYLCEQCDDEELKIVLRDVMSKDWVR